jgi:hypothetical protein
MSKAKHRAFEADGSETVAKPTMHRATFTLPADLARNLSALSKRMGVSQSAIVVDLLQEPIAAIAAIIDDLPPAPSPDDVKRARGRSLQLIEDVMHEATSLAIAEARK